MTEEERNAEMAAFTQYIWEQIANKMEQLGGSSRDVFSDLQSLVMSLQIQVLHICLKDRDLEHARMLLDSNKSQALDVLSEKGWN